MSHYICYCGQFIVWTGFVELNYSLYDVVGHREKFFCDVVFSPYLYLVIRIDSFGFLDEILLCWRNLTS